ncbi:hypothetical protein GCM10010301_56440 [Streptomyces plicatus]|nr:hypothetical protein GCM10010301_56440 [Streptomyces plicatus]
MSAGFGEGVGQGERVCGGHRAIEADPARGGPGLFRPPGGARHVAVTDPQPIPVLTETHQAEA